MGGLGGMVKAVGESQYYVVGLEAANESAYVEVMSSIRMSYVVSLSVSANA